jgi:hypothetical protein
MAEDIQADVAEEQVQPEATQVTFGQGDSVDTPSDNQGQVESESNNSWEGDKRFESHWAKDPNKMYESLRYHEKRQGDFDKQVSDYKKQIEELEKYKNDYTAVEELFNHEQIGNELLGVIDRYKNGTGTTEPQPQTQQTSPEIAQLMEWKANIEQQALSHYQTNQEQAQIKAIDELASKYNVTYDKDNFINYMKESNIPQEYWADKFTAQALSKIMQNHGTKTAQDALQKAANTQSVAVGQSKAQASNAKINSLEEFEQALNQLLPG